MLQANAKINDALGRVSTLIDRKTERHVLMTFRFSIDCVGTVLMQFLLNEHKTQFDEILFCLMKLLMIDDRDLIKFYLIELTNSFLKIGSVLLRFYLMQTRTVLRKSLLIEVSLV